MSGSEELTAQAPQSGPQVKVKKSWRWISWTLLIILVGIPALVSLGLSVLALSFDRPELMAMGGCALLLFSDSTRSLSSVACVRNLYIQPLVEEAYEAPLSRGQEGKGIGWWSQPTRAELLERAAQAYQRLLETEGKPLPWYLEWRDKHFLNRQQFSMVRGPHNSDYLYVYNDYARVEMERGEYEHALELYRQVIARVTSHFGRHTAAVWSTFRTNPSQVPPCLAQFLGQGQVAVLGSVEAYCALHEEPKALALLRSIPNRYITGIIKEIELLGDMQRYDEAIKVADHYLALPRYRAHLDELYMAKARIYKLRARQAHDARDIEEAKRSYLKAQREIIDCLRESRSQDEVRRIECYVRTGQGNIIVDYETEELLEIKGYLQELERLGRS